MIHSIEMKNWRAYEQRKFDFKPGITFLMGANGAGKTSILEAICYGLTGEAALFDSKTRSKLLRNPEINASVDLVFESDDAKYSISRSQSPKSAAEAELSRFIDGRVLASNHSQSTKYISKLMGVSADFLRRIIYMAEGDVFRFISEPPGEALESQIRQVLGLTQLDNFTIALDNSQKKIKQQLVVLQELADDLERLNIKTKSDLFNRLAAGDETRTLLLEQLESNKAKEIQINTSLENIDRLQFLVEKIENSRLPNSNEWNSFSDQPIIEYVSTLEKSITALTTKIQEIAIQKARIEGEKVSQQKILMVLEPFEDMNETIPCPVCQKPMTEHERHSILLDIHKTDQEMNTKVLVMDLENTNSNRDLFELRSRIEILNDLRNIVAHGNVPNLEAASTYGQIKNTISQFEEKRKSLLTVEDERQDIQQKLSDLQSKQADFLTIKNRLSELGFQQPEEVSDNLIALEIRSLAIRSANQASQKTLINQRNSDMQSIYIQVARLWGAFTGEDEWQISLDDKGLPTLANEIGRKFDLQQLSGGEKTALLIMLHTIIAHNFSQCDFIMVDEPLEHLDPVNRRSLIRFLVQSYHRGMFKQAIIATFEESLIRKYLSEDGVNIMLV